MPREVAEAILAGERPANVRVADDYPAEFSAGMAQAVAARGQFHCLVHRFVAHTLLERPESGRVVEKAGFAMARETDDADEAGNVLRVEEWELAI
jgi:hypothetical protein